MSILRRRRIRLMADASKRTDFLMVDVNTSKTPELWKGNDVQFEIALSFLSVLVSDLSNIASLTLEVRNLGSAITNPPLMTATLVGADLDASLTDDTWADGTQQHALVVFTGAESNIPAGSYKLVIGIITNDTPGHEITVGATVLTITEDGIGSGGTPQANDGLAYTRDEADARFVPVHGDQAWWQWRDNCWYGYDVDSDKWYPIRGIKFVDGQPVLNIGPGETL